MWITGEDMKAPLVEEIQDKDRILPVTFWMVVESIDSPEENQAR